MNDSPSKKSALEVREVTVTYGDTVAVDTASFDVAAGEVVALLGPSGCGKSSLLRAIAGLEPIRSGAVLWEGADVSGLAVHRRGFGMVFQDGQLFPHRSVAGNIAYGIVHLNKSEQVEAVNRLLEMVGLEGYGDRKITELSGGQAQRVALARSLAPEPRLLLLDEPLSALDRSLRERLATDVSTSLRAAKMTAIYVTHDHEEAITIADRIAVMGEGRIVQIGTVDELAADPVGPEVHSALGIES